MSNPLERPKVTPEGFPFPYSHYGDPEKRTRLLQDILRNLNLEPKTVANIGCGWDITPSDAFPEARVIHIDIQPEIVTFLREAGFEAYQPEEVPADFRSDLNILILANSAAWDSVPLNDGGLVLTTDGRNMPEDMPILTLVDEDLPPKIVTNPAEMISLWEHGKVHLTVLQPKDSWHS